jgi:hypothetical protein
MDRNFNGIVATEYPNGHVTFWDYRNGRAYSRVEQRPGQDVGLESLVDVWE